MSDPIRQRRTMRVKEQSSFYVFNDDEIILKAKFKWKKKNIKRIEFTLENLLDRGNPDQKKYRYKICCIQRCIGTYGADYDAITLQLSYHDYDSLPEKSKGAIKLKGDGIPFKEGKEQLFVFNVSSDPCKTDSQSKCDDFYDCELYGDTPKTKDGSIIVSVN